MKDSMFDLYARNRLAVIETQGIENIIAFGDIHGDKNAIEKAREYDNGKNILIFLGDYADRGPNGVEVIEGLQDMLNKSPKNVVALKGNHEDYDSYGMPNFSPCDLIEEVERKRGRWIDYFRNMKQNFLDRLYLAAIIPGRILFVHGGISGKINTATDLIYPAAVE